MSIEFRLSDYFAPVALFRLHAMLERSQWWSIEALRNWQLRRLQTLVEHASRCVPYYGELFRRRGLRAADVRSLEDWRAFPLLTKEDVRRYCWALNSARPRRARLCRTSGTSGEPLTLYYDTASRVLEFCYYWRYWSWAGYRLRTPFADFSIQPFISAGLNRLELFDAITGRLLLNPACIGSGTVAALVHTMKRRCVAFIKGSPSTLHVLAGLLEDAGEDGVRPRAVFTTGEMLLAHQRQRIESVFSCRVLDSYGHMERTVAISQCPLGSYHVHAEYGILEVEPLGDGTGRVIGTGLHNFSMPLLRYETGDIVALASDARPCACGRGLPVIGAPRGRSQDALLAEDGRWVTNAFVLLEDIPGIEWFDLRQHKPGRVDARVVTRNHAAGAAEGLVRARLRAVLGERMDVRVEHLSCPPLKPGEKHQCVVGLEGCP